VVLVDRAGHLRGEGGGNERYKMGEGIEQGHPARCK